MKEVDVDRKGMLMNVGVVLKAPSRVRIPPYADFLEPAISIWGGGVCVEGKWVSITRRFRDLKSRKLFIMLFRRVSHCYFCVKCEFLKFIFFFIFLCIVCNQRIYILEIVG